MADALAALAAADPARARFGADHHGYALAPPLAEAEVAAIEAAVGPLPDDLRALVREAGAGGAGPGYGWLPIARVAACAAPPGAVGWTRGLPVAHLGCGYAAVVALDGDARGEVWVDARAAGVVASLAPSFAAWFLDWVDRLARAAWPSPLVPPGGCALAAALGGYLGACEQRLGLAAGSLAGAALRDALEALGPGAIEVVADGAPVLFDDGDRLDPCLDCARLIADLGRDGLARDAVVAGVPPRPLRAAVTRPR